MWLTALIPPQEQIGEDKPNPDIQCVFVNPIKYIFAFLSAL